jgi:hypothetical protein
MQRGKLRATASPQFLAHHGCPGPALVGDEGYKIGGGGRRHCSAMPIRPRSAKGPIGKLAGNTKMAWHGMAWHSVDLGLALDRGPVLAAWSLAHGLGPSRIECRSMMHE